MLDQDARSLIVMGNNHASDQITNELERVGWQVTATSDVEEARKFIVQNRLHVGLINFTQQSSDSYLQNIEEILEHSTYTEWIALIENKSELSAKLRQIIAESCLDFHTLPVAPQNLIASIGHAYGMARMKWDNLYDAGKEDVREEEMVGSSQEIKNLFNAIRKVAPVSAPVLITGESGTGKELTAHAVHERSKYAHGPFITVNCGAIPPSLVQSELFGYEKGAFTGANQRKIGHIEAADSGTIFLDEVGDLPLDQQINLLRFLQEGTIQRVGGNEQIPVDARVIAATHVDLQQAVKNGRLREDLFYRLNVLHLRTPPLRDRPSDIELLANYFFKKFCHEKNKRVQGFSKSCLAVMRDYTWDGNVRELVNRIRHAMVMCENRLISAEDMGIDQSSPLFHFMTLKEAKERAERDAILNTLARKQNNVTLTAKSLGVSRVTLYRLLEKHHLSFDR